MLNPLQSKLLEMMTWFARYLEENNLRYYAIGGTFLGAKRHEGFIPWDDDIDIAMPRKDYEILCDLLAREKDHYIVESPRHSSDDYVYPFAKLYDTSTSMTELLRYKMKRGVYLDIFPLDGLGNTLEEAQQNYKAIDRLNMLLAMKVSIYRSERKWWKNCAVFLGSLIPINPHKLARKLDIVCQKRDFDNCVYVASCMSTYRAKEIMPRKYFGKPQKTKFEDIELYGPELSEEYLTQLFKNWRQLPPENKRCSAHDFKDIDYCKSYLH
ncbi:MAG: LicD family protein [Prevotella sp.]|nr:LicD family protein [Prevotella sp.]